MYKWISKAIVLFILAVSLLLLSVYIILFLSKPILTGAISFPELANPVTINRDAQGVPSISGKNRADVAFATGFLHAQERFFQMDLTRRNSAGELSALFGRPALELDKKHRKHQFRKIAIEAIRLLPEKQKKVLTAYTKGVNAGLSRLSTKPFEYWLLGAEPKPWHRADSLLVIYSMYLDLNDPNDKIESTRGFIATISSDKILNFLSPANTRWDAPLQQSNYQKLPIPNEKDINLRKIDASQYANLTGEVTPDGFIGSNNWAVSGKLTKTGAAIIENDMHLNLRVPNIWYRAQLIYPNDGSKNNIQVTGITLPGLPSIVVGSNQHVAWGFTNSYGDWIDLIKLKTKGNRYFTPQGELPFHTWFDTIEIKDEPPLEVQYKTTRWGPILESPFDHSKFAVTWTAYKPSSTNLTLMELETAKNVTQAMDIANRSGVPQQNFTVGDKYGNIGWTIAGKIPKRLIPNTGKPISWLVAGKHWHDWLAPAEYPRLTNPKTLRIWTANARIASGENLRKIGDGGYALGPRQQQIKDDLFRLKTANEKQMLNIATDNRALYLKNWRKIILKTLTEQTLTNHPERQLFKNYVKQWAGRANVDDVGYRLVREFHDALNKEMLQNISRYLLKTARHKHHRLEDNWIQSINHEREALLRLFEEQPMNWLNPNYNSWDEMYLSNIDKVIDMLTNDCNCEKTTAITNATWGQRNKAAIKHPLSSALPMISELLNMPEVALDGDLWMPNVLRPNAGASERMIVSPSHEEDGIFHMPGGQSGHPLSEYYQGTFKQWQKGETSPFLPQSTKYKLILQNK